MTVTIVTRAQWGARAPKSRRYIATPTRDLWLHHFAGDAWHGAAGMRACQNFHMNSRGWSDIAYSFCVDVDGTIFEGRGAGVAGGHTAGHNSTSHAISWMANTDATKPTRAMVEATARLAAHGQRSGWWGDWTGGHREASGASTSCPGRYGMAALPEIRALTALYLDEPTPTTTPTEEVDMRLLHPHDTKGDSGSIWLLNGGRLGRVADPAELADLQKLHGVQVERIGAKGWAAVKRTSVAIK